MAKADEKILIEVEVDNDKALKQLEKQNSKIEELEESQKKLRKENKQNTVEYQKQAQQLKELRSERNNMVKGITTEANTLGRVKARLREVTIAIDQQNTSTKEGKKALEELRKEQAKLNETLSESEQKGGVFSRNVGNYKSAFQGAISGVSGFGGALEGVGALFTSGPWGLIAGLLGTLVAAFSKTEKGAKLLAATGAVLSSVFDTIVEGVGNLVNFFSGEDPFQKIGDSIKNYLVNQIKLVVDGLGLIGKSISLLFEGEFSQAADTASEGFNKIFVEANPYVQITKAAVEGTIDLTNAFIDNANAAIDNSNAQFELNKARLESQKQIAQLRQEEERLNQIADDATLSLNEQRKANEQYEEAVNKRLQAEQRLLQQELEVLKGRQRENKYDLQLQEEITAKQIELTEKQTEIQQTNYDQQQRQRQINQDQWEQDLDFIIDIGTRRADNLLKQAEDESLSVAQREEAMAKYQASVQRIQEGVRSSFEEAGLSEEEFNKLLGITDPEELAEAIRNNEVLSEIENNRLKEALNEALILQQDELDATKKFEADKLKIKQDAAKQEVKLRKQVKNATINLASDIFQTVGGFLEQGSAAQKGFAIAEATINTYKGITAALSQPLPTPLNIANAALVGAKGFAAVASIGSTNPTSISSGGGSFSSSGATQTAQPQANTNAIDQQLQQQQALIEATNNIGMEVSVTEINDVQNRVRVAENSASI